MKQITKWKLKNKKSNVKINGLKTIYVKGQELYFDGFNALSFDTQPNSKGKTLEYVFDENCNLKQILNIKESHFSVEPIKNNKYFLISKVRNNVPNPINKKYGQAHNPLKNNKKELNNLQKYLLKHYFDIDIDTKPITNIPIQIVYYIRSIEKLFVLYIAEIFSSLNNQYYNYCALIENSEINNSIDLFGTTNFKCDWYDKNNKNQKDCVETIIKYLHFYPRIFFYDKNNKNSDELNEEIYSILKVLASIRNVDVIGLFNKRNNLSDNAMEIAKDFYNESINKFNKEYIEKKLYKIPWNILTDILKDENITNFNDLFYKFNFNNKAKNVGISITKIRNFIIKEDQKKGEYIKKKHIRYIKKCYDFLIWNYLNNNKKTNIFIDQLQMCSTNEEKNNYYEKIIKTDIKVKLNKYFRKLDKKFLQFNDDKKLIKEYKNKKIQINLVDNSKFSDFASLIYIMCCFLEQKEINEFTNYLIKYLSSIENLICSHENNFKDNEKENFEFFFNNYPTFKKENINNLIKCLYQIQVITKLPTNLHDNRYDENFNLNLSYKLLKIKNENIHIDKTIKNNVAQSRKFAYLVKHINLSSCQELLNNTDLLKYIIDNQISDGQIKKYIKSYRKDQKNNANNLNDIVNKIQSLYKIEFIKENINKDWIKNLFQIFLSILFIFTKSLNRINSLYAIAWIMYEQDWYLWKSYHPKLKNESCINHTFYKEKDYNFEIAKEMILDNNNSTNVCGNKQKNMIYKNIFEKYSKFCSENKINSDFKLIRNKVMHMDVLKNFKYISKYMASYNKINYFNIYQFLFQSSFVGNNKNEQIDLFKKNLKGNEENNFNNIYDSKNNVILKYSKKFLKVMNLPFAYCIARYKQLTNEQIFNKLQKFGKDNIKN